MLSLLASFAYAQQPPPFDLSSLGLGPSVSVNAKAEIRWLLAESTSTRFPDDPTPGATFAAGEMVELVVADGPRTRVRKGDRYGWVATSALTMEAPPATQPGQNPLLGTNPLLGNLPPLAPPAAPKSP